MSVFEEVQPGPPPLVSVVVAAYQAEATLPATIASVLDQTHERLELLVVDDGSTDGTPSVIDAAAAADARVVPVSYGGNRGRSAARNEGIARASGDWLAFVDADDLLARDRLEAMLGAAAAEPGCQLVFDDRWGFTVAADGAVTMEHRFPARHTWRTGGSERVDPARHFTDRFGHMDLMVRRTLLERTGATFPEELEIGEDLAFYLTLLFASPPPRAVRLARGSYYYRLGPTSRAAGAADTWQRVIDLVVERTGSDDLRHLADRWQPVHSYLYRRTDEALAAEGRLRDRQSPPDPRVRPSVPLGFGWLLSVKALQWLGRWEDRRTGQAEAARDDVRAQLSRRPSWSSTGRG